MLVSARIIAEKCDAGNKVIHRLLRTYLTILCNLPMALLCSFLSTFELAALKETNQLAAFSYDGN